MRRCWERSGIKVVIHIYDDGVTIIKNIFPTRNFRRLFRIFEKILKKNSPPKNSDRKNPCQELPDLCHPPVTKSKVLPVSSRAGYSLAFLSDILKTGLPFIPAYQILWKKGVPYNPAILQV
jgi:hypothetical protein